MSFEASNKKYQQLANQKPNNMVYLNTLRGHLRNTHIKQLVDNVRDTPIKQLHDDSRNTYVEHLTNEFGNTPVSHLSDNLENSQIKQMYNKQPQKQLKSKPELHINVSSAALRHRSDSGNSPKILLHNKPEDQKTAMIDSVETDPESDSDLRYDNILVH